MQQGLIPMYDKRHIFFIAMVLFSAKTVFAMQQSSGIDEQAKLPFWEISNKGMSLRLVQRLPIQTRGFFLARGFNTQQVERIAQSCVFQTVFKNVSLQSKPSILEYDLRKWIVHYDGKSQTMKLREDWAKEWQQEGIAQAQKLAFEWAMYPTQQQYKPGDYNWGMSIFNLKPGQRFDLQIHWRQFGNAYDAVIKDIQCAPDINPQPGEEQ